MLPKVNCLISRQLLRFILMVADKLNPRSCKAFPLCSSLLHRKMGRKVSAGCWAHQLVAHSKRAPSVSWLASFLAFQPPRLTAPRPAPSFAVSPRLSSGLTALSSLAMSFQLGTLSPDLSSFPFTQCPQHGRQEQQPHGKKRYPPAAVEPAPCYEPHVHVRAEQR
jgi:hypothetical protein